MSNTEYGLMFVSNNAVYSTVLLIECLTHDDDDFGYAKSTRVSFLEEYPSAYKVIRSTSSAINAYILKRTRDRLRRNQRKLMTSKNLLNAPLEYQDHISFVVAQSFDTWPEKGSLCRDLVVYDSNGLIQDFGGIQAEPVYR